MPEFVLCILAITTVLCGLILIPEILKLNKEIAELKQIGKELNDFDLKVKSRAETSFQDLLDDRVFLDSVRARLDALK